MNAAPQLSPAEIEALIQAGVRWTRQWMDYALKRGRPLNEELSELARQAGVEHPERIRILQLVRLPVPEDEALRACPAFASSNDWVIARTFGYGILIRRRAAMNKHLLAHEFVHVGQHERDGSVEASVRSVADGFLKHGINGIVNSPREKEAHSVAARLMGKGLPEHDSRYCGIPWRKGGRDRSGIDCVGLVALFLREEFGVVTELIGSPMDHREIDELARPYLAKAWPERKRGDLVFFRHEESGLVTHVACFLGGGNYLNINACCESRIEKSAIFMRRLGWSVAGAIGFREAEAVYHTRE